MSLSVWLGIAHWLEQRIYLMSSPTHIHSASRSVSSLLIPSRMQKPRPISLTSSAPTAKQNTQSESGNRECHCVRDNRNNVNPTCNFCSCNPLNYCLHFFDCVNSQFTVQPFIIITQSSFNIPRSAAKSRGFAKKKKKKKKRKKRTIIYSCTQ